MTSKQIQTEHTKITAMQDDEAPAANHVVIRVKRKRHEPPLDSIAVSALPSAKRRAGIIGALGGLGLEGMAPADVSTGGDGPDSVHKYVFRRVATHEGQEGEEGALKLASESRASDAPEADCESRTTSHTFMEVKRTRAKAFQVQQDGAQGDMNCQQSGERKAKVVRVHLIDVMGVSNIGGGNKKDGAASAGGSLPPAMTVNGMSLQAQPARVLNPLEREMDHAIVVAFQTGSTLELQQALQQGANVNYSRNQSDRTTALMAASYIGDSLLVSQLLSMGARVQAADVNGNTALDLARLNSHVDTLAILAAAYGRESHGEDWVFDFYRFGGTYEGVGESLVSLQGIGAAKEATDDSALENLELRFDHDSDWSNLSDGGEDDDEDSNDEQFYRNDYPDEGEDDDDEGVKDVYFSSSVSGSSSDSEDLFMNESRRMQMPSSMPSSTSMGLAAGGSNGDAWLQHYGNEETKSSYMPADCSDYSTDGG
jgi:hypothetical protein